MNDDDMEYNDTGDDADITINNDWYYRIISSLTIKLEVLEYI